MTDSYSEERMAPLRQALEAEVLTWPAVSGRKMFGCPSYLAGGKLFAVLVDGHLALTHLGESERAALAELLPVRPFESGRGQVRKWAVAPFADEAALDTLHPFLEQSYRNALDEAG